MKQQITNDISVEFDIEELYAHIVTIEDKSVGNELHLYKDEAIALARAILQHYGESSV